MTHTRPTNSTHAKTGSQLRRRVLKWGVISAILAGAAMVLGTMLMPSKHISMTIVSSNCSTGATFCIDGPSGSDQPVLYPGAPAQNLLLKFTNNMKQTIHLRSLTISLSGTTWQGLCSASDFEVTSSGGTTSLSSPVTIDLTANNINVGQNGRSVTTDGTSAPKIASLSMTDWGNQDDCKSQSLTMTYAGSAGYTLLTNTNMTATQGSGSSATLTATVGPQDAPDTSDSQFTPVGTVQFYQCSSSSSCDPHTDQTVGPPITLSPSSCGSSPPAQSACATYTDPSLNTGAYTFYAIYTPSCVAGHTDCTADTTGTHADFLGSSSLTNGGGTSVTIAGCSTVSAANATQTISSGTTYSGNIEVKSGQTLILEQGATIKGNVTVDSGGSFGAGIGGTGNPATVTGNVQSSGGAVSLSGTSVLSSVQGSFKGLSVLSGTNIKVNLQQTGGGPFCSQGSSSSPVQVGGDLQVQSLAATTTAANICNTTVGGSFTWQSNAAPVSIGGCGSNKVLGNLTVQSDSAPVIVTGNSVTGNITVQSNTYTTGSSLTSNTAGGSCTLQGDKPSIPGSSNTAKGTNTCNRSA